MTQVDLDYGDTKLAVELPSTAVVVRYGKTYTDPPSIDPVEATRDALRSPGESAPLHEFVGPQTRVAIAFPDRVKGGTHALSHRQVAIPLIVEELLRGGAELANITLVCAVGLHRRNTVEEWQSYLGNDIVDQFWPDRLVNHDAEDPRLVDLGTDEMGNVVECNPVLAEADLAIVVGHCSGNPYGGFSGGHKMVATGLTGWRSIASHHTPDTMHRDDWLGASPASLMRRQFRSIAKAIETGIGKQIFAVDAVVGQHADVLAVHAGSLDHVERECWPLATERTTVALPMSEPADILVVGLPRNFHYGPGMGTNPILSGLAIGAQLSRCWYALRPDPVVVAATIGDGWFNDAWFPSYEETFWQAQDHCTFTDYLHSPAARKMATNPGYTQSYSTGFTYHPFHAMSMLSGAAILHERCQDVIMVGPERPVYARAMGFTPTATFDDAMRRATRLVGTNPRVLCTPECFSGGATPHLTLEGDS